MDYKNIEKKQYKLLGKYTRPIVAWGKKTNSVAKCPICKKELTYFRCDEILKIKCDVCPYVSYQPMAKWLRNNELQKKNLKDVFK